LEIALFELCRQASLCSCQDLLQLPEELLPSGLGAAKSASAWWWSFAGVPHSRDTLGS